MSQSHFRYLEASCLACVSGLYLAVIPLGRWRGQFEACNGRILSEVGEDEAANSEDLESFLEGETLEELFEQVQEADRKRNT